MRVPVQSSQDIRGKKIRVASWISALALKVIEPTEADLQAAHMAYQSVPAERSAKSSRHAELLKMVQGKIATFWVAAR
jgi:hypothetical protein